MQWRTGGTATTAVSGHRDGRRGTRGDSGTARALPPPRRRGRELVSPSSERRRRRRSKAMDLYRYCYCYCIVVFVTPLKTYDILLCNTPQRSPSTRSRVHRQRTQPRWLVSELCNARRGRDVCAFLRCRGCVRVREGCADTPRDDPDAASHARAVRRIFDPARG